MPPPHALSAAAAQTVTIIDVHALLLVDVSSVILIFAGSVALSHVDSVHAFSEISGQKRFLTSMRKMI
ncbi:hypothetical protein ASE07_07120 [Noviherbaspirillum sp. Root189]|nr:hypothetical protein ASE07_07120 [Noviherbaspirillum sp. Root189]